MKHQLSEFPAFEEAIQKHELVYLFGTGISASLTGKSYGWWKWIMDGIHSLKDTAAADAMEKRLCADASSENMIRIVGDVIKATKADHSYDKWMQDSFESSHVTNDRLAHTLKKLLLMQDTFATTNYDRLLEEATDLGSLTYQEPGIVFSMLDQRQSTHVLHIHGLYSSSLGIDNIIADEQQYQDVLNDQGAQFVQHILGTRTLIFIGCGQTTEDPNLSRFIRFAKEHLKLDRPYYFLHREDGDFPDMPDNIVMIPFGDQYEDLPEFLEDMAQLRLREKIEKNPIVARTIYTEKYASAFGLAEYHFANEYLRFCGRKVELAQLRNFAESSAQISWWAVTGQAGAGKSRLAYELMHRLEGKYFSFFINHGVSEAYTDQFQPFTNTFVVIDYIKGNEKKIAAMLLKLFQLFQMTSYTLRVLLIERDNLALSGSWIRQLEASLPLTDREAFLAVEYNVDYAARQHRFLYLDDLDEAAVEELIGVVCEKKGLPQDAYRNSRLREEYAAKFEQLRFRPLFVQMFVEAWIENGCQQVDYKGYQDLLTTLLQKEQTRWLEAVGGRADCCSSLIRLLVRAGISGQLDSSALPDMYVSDWEKIKSFNKENTMPGIQREESLRTLIADAEHSTGPVLTVIEPKYPDIIKEAMFLYYTDAEDMQEVCGELWQNCPADFSVFLSRCLLDFPDNAVLRNCVRTASADYQNVFALEARLSLLQNEVVHLGDSPKELISIIREEERFWRELPCGLDSPPAVKEQKVRGLYYSGKQYTGWSRASDAFNCFHAVAALLPKDKDIQPLKVRLLLEITEYFTQKRHWRAAKHILDLLWPVQKKLVDKRQAKLFWLTMQREHMVSLIMQKKWAATERCYNKVKAAVNWTEEQEVELFSYICFSCTKYSWEMLNHSQAMDYANVLQDMAVDYASQRMKIAFNDKIHYYYLHSKFIYTDIASMAFTIAEEQRLMRKGNAVILIDQLISEIEGNEMINDFSGLLVGAKALKIGLDENLQDPEVQQYLSEADALQERYPDNALLGEWYIMMYKIAYEYQYRRMIPAEAVRKAYVILLRFPRNEKVLENFFEMLALSEERQNKTIYTRSKAVVAGLIENHLMEYLVP